MPSNILPVIRSHGQVIIRNSVDPIDSCVSSLTLCSHAQGHFGVFYNAEGGTVWQLCQLWRV